MSGEVYTLQSRVISAMCQSACKATKITPEMIEAGAICLHDLVGEGTSDRSSLNHFRWMFDQSLRAAGLQTEEPSTD
jgi:hypothetical protein